MINPILGAALLAFGAFFIYASPVNAQTFTLPHKIQHSGLTFTEPLTYAHAKDISFQKTTVAFGKTQTLEMKDHEKKEPIENIILTPTLNPSPKVRSTIIPTPTIYIQSTQAPIASPKPTKQITPTPTPQPIATKAPTGGLDPEKLFSMANAYRQSKGLPALQKDERACTLAASRAPEVAGEIAAGTLHSGLQARNLPYWNTENIISMNSEEAAFNWWINDTIHKQAIEGNYTYSCVACSGNNCAQEFTNFQPK